MKVGSLTIEMAANVARVASDMDQVRRSVDGAMSYVTDRVEMAKKAMLGLAGIGSAAMFVGLIKGSIDGAAALHDLSIQTGATVESLSAMAAVGKLSNQSADSIANAMGKLARNMANTSEESRGTGKAIAALGLDYAEFSRMSPEDQMQAVAVAMNGFKDGSGKAAVAMALFGKEGAKMLPFLKDLAEVGDLQAKVTTAQAAAADNFSDNLIKLKTTGQGWTKEIAMGMVPALNVASQAFLDVMNGTGGLRDESRKLSADGSITEWTYMAINGLSRVADMGAVVWRTLKTIGMGLGGYVAMLVQALQGDFKGAVATYKAIGTDIADMWAEQTLGQQLRNRIEQIRALGDEGKKAGKALNFTNVLAGDKAAAEKASEYDKLIQKIREKTAATDLEAQQDVKLSDGQKLALEAMVRLRDNTLQLTEAQRQQLAAALQAMLASEQLAAAHAAETKATKEAAEAHAKYVTGLAAELDKTLEQVEQQRLHNAQIGLGKEAVEALSAAKIEQQAVTLELQAVRALDKNLDEAEYNLLKARAAALRELASLKRDAAARQVAVDEAKKAEEAWGKFTDSVFNGLTDSLYRAFEAGKGFFETLWSGIKNTFKTTVLKLMIQGTVGGIAGAIGMPAFAGNAASSASSVLGSLGNLGSLFGGGSGGIMNGLSAWAEGGSVMNVLSNPGLYSGSELLGAALPGVGMALGGIMLASKLFGSKGGPKTEGGYSNIAGLVASTNGRTYQNGFYGGANDSAAQALVQSLGSGYAGILAALGVKGGALTGQAFVDADPNGTSGNALDFQASLNGRTIYNRFDALGTNRAGMTDAEAQGAAQLAVQTALVEALKVTDLGGPLNAYLASVSTQGSSLESLAAVIADVQGVGALQKQFAELQGSSVEAVKALAQAAGGFDALAQVLTTRRAWQDQLDLLQGKVTQDELDLQRDLASTTDEATQALIRQVYAQRQANAATTAAAQAAEAAAAAAQAAAQAQKSAAIDAYNRAVDAERNRLQALADASAATVDRIQSIFDLLDESTRSLYGSVASTAALQAAQGRAFISSALALANAGGVLPNQAALQNAIGAATAGLSARPYASRQDSDFARLVLAGELRQLQAKTGTQLTAAQQALDVERSQLAALNAQAEAMQQQIDALNGVHTSVLSVDEAVRNLTALMFPSGDTNTAQAMAAAGASGGAVFGGGVGSGAGGYVFNPSDFGGVDATTYATSLGGILAALGGGGGAVVQAVGELREEVRELRAVQEQAAESAARTASVLQGNEGTILVRTV